MIRFGAIVSVVAVAIGLLAAGAVSGTLALVYLAIGLAALALLMLIVGVAIWRENLFGAAAAPAEARRGSAQPGESGREAAAATRALAPSGRGQAGGEQSAEQVPAPSYGGGAARPGLEDAPLPGPMRPGEAGRPAKVDTGRPAGADTGQPPGERERSPSGGASKRRTRRDTATDWSGSVPPPAAAAGHGLAHPDGSRAPSAVGTAPPPSPPAARSAATGTIPASAAPGRAGPGSGGPGSAGPGSAGPGSAGPGSAGPGGGARAAGSAGTAPARAESAEPRRSGRGSTQRQAGFTWSPETLSASDEREQAPVPPPARGAASATAPSSVFDVTGAHQSRERVRPDARPSDTRAAEADAAGPQATVKGNGPAAASAAAAPGRDAPATTGPTAQTIASPRPAADPGMPAADRGEASAGARSGRPAEDAGSGSAGGPATGSDPAGGGSAVGASAAPVTARVSVVPGIARYHTAECILIRFLGEEDLQTMSRQEAEAAGNVPCRACKPDKLPASA